MRKTFKQIMSIMLVAALALGGTPFTAKASIDIKQEENNKNKKEKSYVEGQAVILYKESGKNVSTQSITDSKVKIKETYDFQESKGKVKTYSNNDASDVKVSLVESDSYSTEELIAKMKNKVGVISVQPNYIYKASDYNDKYYKYQWSQENVGQNGGTKGLDINADSSALADKDNKEKVVAIVDTGVDYTHEDLKDKMDFHFNTAVSEIKTCSEGYELVTEKGDVARCQYLIAAPGRSGAEWFANQCKNLGIKLINNQVDIGVRVELPARVFEHITDVVYESKLVYRTKQYGDSVRTFCMNPYGHVVAENVEGINTVNGHSYSDASLRSENTNFALLVSNRFTEPFDEPYRYGKHIASLSNMLAGGVLVQRFGDLVKGIRTNEHRLSQSFVKPTLTAAVPGDLSLALPKRQLDDIIEMIYALDKVAPGTANYDTLLYGAEVKFYSSRLELSHELETKLPGFFAIGDGAGTTRGLAQAGASGIKAARAVLARL